MYVNPKLPIYPISLTLRKNDFLRSNREGIKSPLPYNIPIPFPSSSAFSHCIPFSASNQLAGFLIFHFTLFLLLHRAQWVTILANNKAFSYISQFLFLGDHVPGLSIEREHPGRTRSSSTEMKKSSQQ